MKALGIYREVQNSPNRESDDALVLRAVMEQLSILKTKTTLITPEEFDLVDASGYDLIVPTGNAVEALIRSRQLRPLDKAKLKNLGNIKPEFLNAFFDPGNRYSVPSRYCSQCVTVAFHPEKIEVDFSSEKFDGHYQTTYEGVIPNLERRHHETDSSYVRTQIEAYMFELPCPKCEGKRLKKEILGVTVGDKNIVEASALSISNAKKFYEELIPGKKETEETEESEETEGRSFFEIRSVPRNPRHRRHRLWNGPGDQGRTVGPY